MITTHHITNQTELEELIGRYFDGETTVQEEKSLREALADCTWNSETIDEARFTMGYFIAHKQRCRRANIFARRISITAAASIALLLTIGIGLLWHNSQQQNVCIAYVNGKVIHNEKEVMNLMASDLNDIGNASHGLAEQLSSLGDDIEIDI